MTKYGGRQLRALHTLSTQFKSELHAGKRASCSFYQAEGERKGHIERWHKPVSDNPQIRSFKHPRQGIGQNIGQHTLVPCPFRDEDWVAYPWKWCERLGQSSYDETCVKNLEWIAHIF
ncbi:hypothetical protein AA103581_0201 [Gluconobacter wancherniae NBRC 103581]|nr:hypothetical protein AA103581_0201 [Gluconobacter wancherniae NBRC 103581]